MARRPSTSSASLMLVGTARQLPPSSLMVATTSSRVGWVRPAMTTWAPRVAKDSATSRPSPVPPPVMTATLPAKRSSAKTETPGPRFHLTGCGSTGEVPTLALLVVVEHVLGDEDAVYLVGPVGQTQRPGSQVHGGQRQVVGDAGSPPHLYGPIDHARVGRRHEDLYGGDLCPRLGVALVDLLGGMDGQEAGGLDVGVAIGDEPLHELLVPQESTVDLPCQQALDHEIEGSPHLPYRVHAVEDAAGAQAVLGRPVPVAHLAQQVVHGDAHIVVADFAVVGRGTAPDADASLNDDAGRRGGHDDLHHPTGPVVVGRLPGPAHDDEEVGLQPVGGEPLVPVDHPLVAHLDGAGLRSEERRVGEGV